PWIDSGATSRLEKGRAALDQVIVEKLGTDSNVRNRLTTLNVLYAADWVTGLAGRARFLAAARRSLYV
ncbi:hypothetical protein HZD82_23360, partial [Pantoea agglomerans]|nr:hypothetical protein [Pantoea agglomerans]